MNAALLRCDESSRVLGRGLARTVLDIWGDNATAARDGLALSLARLAVERLPSPSVVYGFALLDRLADAREAAVSPDVEPGQ